MTRETKVGMVVASTFVCLLSVVVVSKLRQPEPPLEGDPQEPPPTVSSPVAQASKPIAPPPSSSTNPPSLSISSRGESPPLPTKLPKVKAPGTPAPPASVLPPPAPVEPSPPAQVDPPLILPPAAFGPVATAPPSAPMPEVPADPGPFVGPLPQPTTTPAEVAKRKLSEPKPTASPMPSAGLPLVPLPTSAPELPVELPKPVVKNETPKAEPPPVPAPLGPLEPKIGLSEPMPVAQQKPAPLAEPPLPDAVRIVNDKKNTISVPPVSPLPGPDKADPPPLLVSPLTDRKPMPSASDAPAVSPPVITKESTPTPPPLTTTTPAPAPRKIPVIGTSGNAANLPSVVITPGGMNTAVPALTASARALPKVSSYADEIRYVKPGEKSFDVLSNQYYGSAKYAGALLEYNRQHVLGRSNPNLQREQPVLVPNQVICYPPVNVLESQYSRYITAATRAVLTVGSPTPAVQISPPMPLTSTAASAAPPTADPVVTWTVRETQHIFAIAQQTLGNGNLWTEILRLNPTLRTDQLIPAGTQLRLPATARIN